MKNSPTPHIISAVSLRHLIFILCLGFAIIDFIVSLSFEYPGIRTVLDSLLQSAALTFFCLVLLFVFWIAISLSFKKESRLSLRYGLIILSPILLLLFWRPQGPWPLFIIPIAISLLTLLCFFIILSRQDFPAKIDMSRQKIFIAAAILVYFSVFSYIIIQKFNSFSLFNPVDFAIYNQTFWNTVNGWFFQNSVYGSNFACHNTVFFLALVPFYYIFPHPLTLLISKTLLLALSAIPFWIIARYILKDICALIFTIAYLLYPFLVSQNFAPPHEICYLPLFILFTYYFFRLDRFELFMLCLIISVSIKEHLSLTALN